MILIFGCKGYQLHVCGEAAPVGIFYNCTHQLPRVHNQALRKVVDFWYKPPIDAWEEIYNIATFDTEDNTATSRRCPTDLNIPTNESLQSSKAFCKWTYTCSYDDHRIPAYIYNAKSGRQVFRHGNKLYQCKPLATLINTIRIACTGDRESWQMKQEKVTIGYHLVCIGTNC